jgi:hypothetical protein
VILFISLIVFILSMIGVGTSLPKNSNPVLWLAERYRADAGCGNRSNHTIHSHSLNAVLFSMPGFDAKSSIGTNKTAG